MQGGAARPLGPCPAHTGAKVYKDDKLSSNNPLILKGKIHILVYTEVVAAINLVFETTPNSSTLDARNTHVGAINTGSMLFREYLK